MKDDTMTLTCTAISVLTLGLEHNVELVACCLP